jgi:hypothetical protein
MRCFIDDPDDAHGRAQRELSAASASAKMRALSSRLNDKRHFVMLLVQQRVHIDDCVRRTARQRWLAARAVPDALPRR